MLWCPSFWAISFELQLTTPSFLLSLLPLDVVASAFSSPSHVVLEFAISPGLGENVNCLFSRFSIYSARSLLRASTGISSLFPSSRNGIHSASSILRSSADISYLFSIFRSSLHSASSLLRAKANIRSLSIFRSRLHMASYLPRASANVSSLSFSWCCKHSASCLLATVCLSLYTSVSSTGKGVTLYYRGFVADPSEPFRRGLWTSISIVSMFIHLYLHLHIQMNLEVGHQDISNA